MRLGPTNEFNKCLSAGAQGSVFARQREGEKVRGRLFTSDSSLAQHNKEDILQNKTHTSHLCRPTQTHTHPHTRPPWDFGTDTGRSCFLFSLLNGKNQVPLKPFFFKPKVMPSALAPATMTMFCFVVTHSFFHCLGWLHLGTHSEMSAEEAARLLRDMGGF